MDETEHYHHQKGKKMERKDGIISESKTAFIHCYYIQQWLRRWCCRNSTFVFGKKEKKDLVSKKCTSVEWRLELSKIEGQKDDDSIIKYLVSRPISVWRISITYFHFYLIILIKWAIISKHVSYGSLMVLQFNTAKNFLFSQEETGHKNE